MSESFFIQISPDLTDVLEDSEKLRRQVQSELQKEGINGQVDWQRNPLSTEPDRELVLLVLAIGATSMMVGTAVKRVIDALNRGKPTVVSQKELIPALDGAGNSIRDSEGNPVFQARETPQVYPANQETDSTRVKAGTVFEFSTGAGKVAEQQGQSQTAEQGRAARQGRST